MKNLRNEYLSDWRVWYSMQYKAHNVYYCDLEADWNDFETWLGEFGCRPADHYRFVRRDIAKGFVRGNCSWIAEPRGPRAKWFHKEDKSNA